jgi:hypothetical protein
MWSKPAGDGERGRGEDDGGVVSKSVVGEELGDVDGRGLQVVWKAAVRGVLRARAFRTPPGGAALDPEDGVAVGGFEEELQVGADVGGALAQAGGFVDVLERSSSPSRRVRALRVPSVGVAATLRGRLRGRSKGMRPIAVAAGGGATAKNMRARSRGWRRRFRWRWCWRLWP